MYECHWTCQLPCTRGEATCRIYRWNYVITGIWISRKYSNIPPFRDILSIPPFSCDSFLLQSLCFLRKNHTLGKNGKLVNAAEILEIVEFIFSAGLSLQSASSIKPFLGWKLERYIFYLLEKDFWSCPAIMLSGISQDDHKKPTFAPDEQITELPSTTEPSWHSH